MNKCLYAVISLIIVLILLAPDGSQATIAKSVQAQEEPLRTLEGHTDRVLSVAFSPEGQMLASGSWDETVKLWRVSDGQQLRTLGEDTPSYGFVCNVAFSPDGQMLASVACPLGGGRILSVWRVSDGSLLHTHRSSVPSVAFSPDGQTLVSSNDITTLVHNQETFSGIDRCCS